MVLGTTIGCGGHAHLRHFVRGSPWLSLRCCLRVVWHFGVLSIVEASLRADSCLGWIELDSVLRGRPASCCGVGAPAICAVVLPAADRLGAVDRKLLPVLYAGFLVEERGSGAVAVGRSAVLDVGGHAGELVSCNEWKDLEEKLLGVVEAVFEAFDVAFCGPGEGCVSETSWLNERYFGR